MDNALRRLALLFALAMPCHAQGILAPILFGPGTAPPSGTNINFVNQSGAGQDDIPDGGTTPFVYTCQSTSNRIIMFIEAGVGATAISMSDTGGEIASATTLLSGHFATDSVYYLALNVGCYSGANTFTETNTGAGAYVRMTIAEYSGVTSGKDGSGNATYGASAGSCSISATSAQVGDLAVAYSSWPPLGQVAAWQLGGYGFTLRTLWGSNGTLGSITYGSAFSIVSDNLYAPSGTVNYSVGWSSNAVNHCLEVLIPGTSATSPAFYPNIVQAYTNCSLTGTNPTFAMKASVTSGDLIIAGFTDNSTATPSSVTDSLSSGTVYTSRVTKTSGSNEIILYTGVTTAGGSNTLTVHGTGFNSPCVDITEIHGLTGTVTDTGGLTTSANTMTWSQSVTNANSAVYALCSKNATGSGTIAASTFSLTSGTGGFGQSSVGEWTRALSSGSVSPSCAMGSSHNNIGASITLQ